MPVNLHGRSQKPPEQNPVQHWVPTVQLLLVCVQLTPPSLAGPHFDGEPAQLKLQQSAPCPQVAPSPRQGTWHVFVPPTSMQRPLQQFASIVHDAPVSLHWPGSF